MLRICFGLIIETRVEASKGYLTRLAVGRIAYDLNGGLARGLRASEAYYVPGSLETK